MKSITKDLALRQAREWIKAQPRGWMTDGFKEVVADIEQALAQPAQEDDNDLRNEFSGLLVDGLPEVNSRRHDNGKFCYGVEKQYQEWKAMKAQPAQEPVAWQWLGSAQFRKKIPKNGDKTAWNPLYTTPPQRPWVELEGKEIRDMWEEATKPERSTMTMVTSFAKAIEAKLKNKNI